VVAQSIPPARRPRGIRTVLSLPARFDRFGSLLALGLAAQLIVLLPVARTAFWGDDAANAYTTGYLRWGGKAWWPFFWASNQAQVRVFGRPMPLGVLQTYGLFDVLHSRLAYKLLLITLTLLASALLALVARRLGATPARAALISALPAVVWQLHLLHDPLMSYVGLMQMLVIYAAASMLVFSRWLERGGWWRAVIVVLLTICGCVTYESGYLLPLVLVFVAWRQRGCRVRRAILLAWPGLVVAGCFILLAAVLGLGLSSASGYHPSHDPGTIVSSWVKVVTSGLPVIGWATAGGPRTLAAVSWRGPIETGVITAVLLVPLLVAAARSSAEPRPAPRRGWIALAGIAATLMLTPSLLTALAPQYQSLLTWGWGYLPMFFAGLGWSVLGALAITGLLRKLNGRPRMTVIACVALALLAGSAVTANAQENERVATYMAPVARSRALVESSFTHGVLATVPTFSTVLWYVPDVAIPVGTWVPGAFNMEAWTREFVNRPLTMRLVFPSAPSPVLCADASGSPTRCRLLRTPTFWLRTAESGTTGFVSLTQVNVRRWRATDNTLSAQTRAGATPIVFVQDPRITSGGGPLPFSVTVADPGPASVPGARLRVIRRGSGWAVVRLPPQPSFIATSLGVRFS
jgi:hypothetical protein